MVSTGSSPALGVRPNSCTIGTRAYYLGGKVAGVVKLAIHLHLVKRKAVPVTGNGGP
jgi:hypothetical protein